MRFSQIKKTLLVVRIAILATLTSVFVGCNSKVVVVLDESQSGVDFSFTVALGSSSVKLFSSLFQNSSENQNASVFDEDAIRKSLVDCGVKNAFVKNADASTLQISGTLEKGSSNPFTQSGMLEFSQNAKIIISDKTLRSWYKILPSELKTYLDMLASPCFSDEQMDNTEYLELIGTIYGDEIAGELLSSEVQFIVQNKTTKSSEKNVLLLDILNIKNPIEI